MKKFHIFLIFWVAYISSSKAQINEQREENCPDFVINEVIPKSSIKIITPEEKNITNKVLQFTSANTEGNGIGIPGMEKYYTNFSYDFWAFTERTITLLSEKTTGVTVNAIYGQNFVVAPGHGGMDGLKRGSGVSLGTNGISVVEHEHNFFDARLTVAKELNGWNHYCVVYENNAIKLYINGELVRERSAVGKSIYPSSIGFGYPSFDTNDGYTGKLDEYRVWDKSLTIDEVNIIKNKKITNSQFEHLVVSYSFDCCFEPKDNSYLDGYIDGDEVGIDDSQYVIEEIPIDGYLTGSSLSDYTIESDLIGFTTYAWPDGRNQQSFELLINQDTTIFFNSINNGAICRDSVFYSIDGNALEPIAFYPFSGNADDESTNQNHGVLNGPVLTNDRFGNLKSAYAFDGVDDFIELTNTIPINLGGEDYTISLYVNPRHNEDGYLIGKSRASEWLTFDKGIEIYNNNLAFNSCNQGMPNVGPIDQNQWSHVVLVYKKESDSLYYYLNVQKMLFESPYTTFDLGDDAVDTKTFFGKIGTGKFFHGSLDDIKVFDQALSESEILNLFDLPRIDLLTTTSVNLGDAITITGDNLNRIDSIFIGGQITKNNLLHSDTEMEITIPLLSKNGIITTYTGGVAYNVDQTINLNNQPGLLTLKFPTMVAAVNDSIKIGLTVENFTELLSAQFTVNWDPNILSYRLIDKFVFAGVNINEEQVGNGKLSLSWNDEALIPQSLTDDDTLLLIGFDVIGQKDQVSMVSLSDDLTKIEFGDKNYLPVDYKLIAGSVTVVKKISLFGNITTRNNLSLDKVNILYNVDKNLQNIETGADGAYSIEYIQGQLCQITPDEFPDNGEFHGVTTLDIALGRRDILGIKKLDDPYAEIAADVNRDGSISTIDLALMRRVVLAITNEFPGNRLVQFVRPKPGINLAINAYDTTWRSDHQPYSDNIDFKAVKTGDVNASWKQSGGRTKTVGELLFIADQVEMINDSIFTLALVGFSDHELSGYQFGLHWNSEKYEFIEMIPSSTTPVLNNQASTNGDLYISWDNLEGGSQNINGDTLFELAFKRRTYESLFNIELIGSKLPIEAYNQDLDFLEIRMPISDMRFTGKNESVIQLQAFPNPFDTYVQFTFNLSHQQEILIEFFDVNGKQVDRIKQSCQTGKNTIKWQPNQPVLDGSKMFFYRTNIEGQDVSGKLIVK